MNALRGIQQTCEYLRNITVYQCNAIISFKTYCTPAKTQTKIQSVKDEQHNNNNSSNKQLENVKLTTIDETTIRKIERLALVGFEYERSKRVLEEAITFAERLRQVHIDKTVRPMYSTLENEHIRLREDVVYNAIDRREILKNATVLEEEYFVAPLETKAKSNKNQ